MRQLGILPSQRDAQRFAAWLVSQRIEAHAEQGDGGWWIWVRDEDHLPRAREALAHFRDHPNDPQYHSAERTAEAVLRDEAAKRKQAQKNVVEMRGRWGGGTATGGVSRRCPLVMALIGASILAAIATNDDTMGGRRAGQPPGALYLGLVFVDPNDAVTQDQTFNMWASVNRGEVWRLVTPIFIHYGWAHLILNMIWLYSFGGQIEDRKGTWRMALLVLALAITSNVGQAMETTLRNQPALFGGMSGVGYGLFGYMLVKVKYDNRDRFFLAPGTTFIALLWFALCIAREIPPFSSMLQDAIPPIANSAHAVGLAVGALVAYTPLLVRKPA